MILFNNLDKSFSNVSIIFVDSRVSKTQKIQLDNMIIFSDDNKKIHSINLLDNKLLDIEPSSKFGALNAEQIAKLSSVLVKNGFALENEPKIIYGLITKRENHPKSEKLFVLEVLINKETNEHIQLVTNTLDSQEGKVVVLSLPGSTVFSGLEVLEGEMLNVKSYGMLSGYRTLGIDREGLIFGTSEQIGKDFEF
ncbi:hypothetical protein NPA13_00265 [Mycoplasma sp. 2045]|uniref:TyrS-associated PheT N-terminal domain-related protein TapR n=1 Tax=Mycoplasma sp. 2045 TaxID=2967301 RepID=UPI00211CBD3D|nr:hypothetical protein [Mycoplasma sp. 2045]UUM20453.1 hypothetical protein NPA13_00265 [Mycoplasma sp. 2045]